MPLPTLPQPRFRAAAAAVLLACLGAPAQAGVGLSIGLNFPIGHHHHGHRGAAHGAVHGSLPHGAVSVQIGGGHYWRHGGVFYRPWGPRWMVVTPPVLLGETVLVHAAQADLPLPVASSRPDPVIYPRNGQNAERTEADRQACNRSATTQPAALVDANVFHRAVQACMDGRGYTMK